MSDPSRVSRVAVTVSETLASPSRTSATRRWKIRRQAPRVKTAGLEPGLCIQPTGSPFEATPTAPVPKDHTSAKKGPGSNPALVEAQPNLSPTVLPTFAQPVSLPGPGHQRKVQLSPGHLLGQARSRTKRKKTKTT